MGLFWFQLDIAMFAIDEDGSGVLDLEEMDKLFLRMGKQLDRKRLAEVFAEIDTDGGGEVEIGEFERYSDGIRVLGDTRDHSNTYILKKIQRTTHDESSIHTSDS